MQTRLGKRKQVDVPSDRSTPKKYARGSSALIWNVPPDVLSYAIELLDHHHIVAFRSTCRYASRLILQSRFAWIPNLDEAVGLPCTWLENLTVANPTGSMRMSRVPWFPHLKHISVLCGWTSAKCNKLMWSGTLRTTNRTLHISPRGISHTSRYATLDTVEAQQCVMDHYPAVRITSVGLTCHPLQLVEHHPLCLDVTHITFADRANRPIDMRMFARATHLVLMSSHHTQLDFTPHPTSHLIVPRLVTFLTVDMGTVAPSSDILPHLTQLSLNRVDDHAHVIDVLKHAIQLKQLRLMLLSFRDARLIVQTLSVPLHTLYLRLRGGPRWIFGSRVPAGFVSSLRSLTLVFLGAKKMTRREPWSNMQQFTHLALFQCNCADVQVWVEQMIGPDWCPSVRTCSTDYYFLPTDDGWF